MNPSALLPLAILALSCALLAADSMFIRLWALALASLTIMVTALVGCYHLGWVQLIVDPKQFDFNLLPIRMYVTFGNSSLDKAVVWHYAIPYFDSEDRQG